MNFKELYNETKHKLQPIDLIKVIKKWEPVLEKKKTFENKFVEEELSIIMEIYQQMDVPKVVSPLTIEPQYPEGYMLLPEVFDFINEGMIEFIKDDTDTKLKIVDEYYNAVTGKRGLLLENNIMMEEGKFLDKKHQDIVDMELKKIIDRRLEFVLIPEKRILLEREKKLKRILKKK